MKGIALLTSSTALGTKDMSKGLGLLLGSLTGGGGGEGG